MKELLEKAIIYIDELRRIEENEWHPVQHLLIWLKNAKEVISGGI